MGFREGAFATVWQVEQKNDRWTKIRINISRKNKDTDALLKAFNISQDAFLNALMSVRGKVSGSAGGTENTASGIQPAVPVGTGHIRAQGQFIDFTAEAAAQVLVQK